MDLNALYQLYYDSFALPKTRNPIKVYQRELMRKEISRQILTELDRRIASIEKA